MNNAGMKETNNTLRSMAQMSTSPGLNWFWSFQHSTSYDRAVARESQLGGGGSGTALLGGLRGMPP